MSEILEAVKEWFDKPNEYKAWQDYLQYVVGNRPEFPQVVATNLLSLVFVSHVNMVSSGQVGKAELVFEGSTPQYKSKTPALLDLTCSTAANAHVLIAVGLSHRVDSLS
jgi:hypothetical protein